MKDTTHYKVIGMMSGTSLDGLDIAFCTFRKDKSGWNYKIEKATTLKYSQAWLKKLSAAHQLAGEELMELHTAYGLFTGEVCLDFIRRNKLKPDFISAHGHTIFHQPDKNFTFQLGDGSAIHAATGIPVAFDFRSLDVALGGEGAPLVPAGDKFLFSEYDVCVNLGGIANLSRDIGKKRIAYDICFSNMGLNYLTATIGKEFDEGGKMASQGEINKPMLAKLKKIYHRFRKKRPSLGREIFEQQLQPLIDDHTLSLTHKLRTLTESAALEITDAILSEGGNPRVLCTGGGAFNSFLISRLLEHCSDHATLILPEEEVVKFKEALVFAFLAVLKVRGEVNCLKSVSGATRDSSSGVMVGFRD